jgi:hypothetical protein
MKHTTKQWLVSAAAAAVLATGCAGRPAPRPAPRTPIGQAGLIPNTAGSTTGDADACAIALGNAVAGMTAGWTGTAPGPNATAVTPGGPAAGPTGNLAGTPGATGYPGTMAGYGAARHEVTANGVLIGNVALVALPTVDNLPITPGPGTAGMTPGVATPRAFTTPGVGPAVRPGGITGPAAAPAGTETDAISRIRAACTKVTEIRVVHDAGDRARLATVTMAIRKGTPITTFLDDLVRINRRAATAGGGVNTAVQPGAVPGGTTVAPPAVPGPGMAPGTTTTAPGTTTTAPGTTTMPPGNTPSAP